MLSLVKFDSHRSQVEQLRNETLQAADEIVAFVEQLRLPTSPGGLSDRVQLELSVDGLINANQRLTRVLSIVAAGMIEKDSRLSASARTNTSTIEAAESGRDGLAQLLRTVSRRSYPKPEVHIERIDPVKPPEILVLERIITRAQREIPKEKGKFVSDVNAILRQTGYRIRLADGAIANLSLVRGGSGKEVISFGLLGSGNRGGFRMHTIELVPYLHGDGTVNRRMHEDSTET